MCSTYRPQSIRHSKMSWCYNFYRSLMRAPPHTTFIITYITEFSSHIQHRNRKSMFRACTEKTHGLGLGQRHSTCAWTINTQRRQQQLAHGEIWKDNNIQSTMVDVTGKRNEFRWQHKCTRGPYRLRVCLRECNTVLSLLRAERIQIQTPQTVSSSR